MLKAVRALEEVETELSKQKDALKEVRITQKTVAENEASSRKSAAEVCFHTTCFTLLIL